MALLDNHKLELMRKVFRIGKRDERMFIRTSDLARMLGVAPKTVGRWVSDGKIECCDTTPGGKLLFDWKTVEEIVKGIPQKDMLDT